MFFFVFFEGDAMQNPIELTSLYTLKAYNAVIVKTAEKICCSKKPEDNALFDNIERFFWYFYDEIVRREDKFGVNHEAIMIDTRHPKPVPTDAELLEQLLSLGRKIDEYVAYKKAMVEAEEKAKAKAKELSDKLAAKYKAEDEVKSKAEKKAAKQREEEERQARIRRSFDGENSSWEYFHGKE